MPLQCPGSMVSCLLRSRRRRGERFAILFAPAAGQPVADIAPQQARAYGRLAAALHMATDAAPTVYRRFHIDECHLLDEPLAAVRRAGIDGGEDLMFLERTAERVRRCLAGLPRSSPAYGLCHGDLHPGNICIDSEGQPTLFDFDFVWYGWRAYDLTVFLWNAYGERRSQRWRDSRWRAFLHGYREVQPLPEGLEEMVPLFLVARQIWLMGLDCADRSGMPPQWLTPGWLRETVRPMRTGSPRIRSSPARPGHSPRPCRSSRNQSSILSGATSLLTVRSGHSYRQKPGTRAD